MLEMQMFVYIDGNSAEIQVADTYFDGTIMNRIHVDVIMSIRSICICKNNCTPWLWISHRHFGRSWARIGADAEGSTGNHTFRGVSNPGPYLDGHSKGHDVRSAGLAEHRLQLELWWRFQLMSCTVSLNEWYVRNAELPEVSEGGLICSWEYLNIPYIPRSQNVNPGLMNLG